MRTLPQNSCLRRRAIARIRAMVQRWGIGLPAIPELGIEGVDNISADISPQDIVPAF